MGCRTIGAGINEAEASEPVYLDEAGGIGMFGVVYYKDFLKAGADKPGCITYDEPEKIRAIIEKIKATPKQYPRKFAKIKQSPL